MSLNFLVEQFILAMTFFRKKSKYFDFISTFLFTVAVIIAFIIGILCYHFRHKVQFYEIYNYIGIEYLFIQFTLISIYVENKRNMLICYYLKLICGIAFVFLNIYKHSLLE